MSFCILQPWNVSFYNFSLFNLAQFVFPQNQFQTASKTPSNGTFVPPQINRKSTFKRPFQISLKNILKICHIKINPNFSPKYTLQICHTQNQAEICHTPQTLNHRLNQNQIKKTSLISDSYTTSKLDLSLLPFCFKPWEGGWFSTQVLEPNLTPLL